MNTLEYKGFNIYELSNGRFAPQDKGDAHFNGKGYATLNTAKGAITKYLKEQEEQKANVETLRVALKERDDNGDAFYGMLESEEGPADVTLSESSIAAMVAHEKQQNKIQSRNKREGKFIGKIETVKRREMEYYRGAAVGIISIGDGGTNRKQRKAHLLAHRNMCKEIGCTPATMLEWGK